MKSISLDITKATQFLKPGTVEDFESKVKEAQDALEKGTCPGNDFLGWASPAIVYHSRFS